MFLLFYFLAFCLNYLADSSAVHYRLKHSYARSFLHFIPKHNITGSYLISTAQMVGDDQINK